MMKRLALVVAALLLRPVPMMPSWSSAPTSPNRSDLHPRIDQTAAVAGRERNDRVEIQFNDFWHLVSQAGPGGQQNRVCAGW